MTIRNALLTVTTASATFTTVFACENLADAQSTARACADAKLAVSLKRTDREYDPAQDEVGYAVSGALAAVARSCFAVDSTVEFRTMRNYCGEMIVWILMQSTDAKLPRGSKRGYVLAFCPSSQHLQIVSGGPTAGLYTWGLERCRQVKPTDCAREIAAWSKL